VAVVVIMATTLCSLPVFPFLIGVGENVALGVVTHRNVGAAHERAVLVGALKDAYALDATVVGAGGLVELQTDLFVKEWGKLTA